MLKREITYEDFDGEKVTEVFYFNLSKPELVELEVEYEGGFGQMIRQVIKAENVKALIKEFKNIILMSYGEKSEDGKRFVKSEELRTAFSQTGAYEVLFMELATDDKAAAVFIQGILPRDMATEFAKQVEDNPLPAVPPTPPSV